MPDTTPWKQEIARRLAGLRLAPEREAEIVEELAAHLDDEYRKTLASGATENEAREMALDSLNGAFPLAEELRRVEHRVSREPVVLGAEGKSLLGDFWRDLRYALRTFQRAPGFTALAVLSLALGIGGNAAIFTIVSAVLIQPLPYWDPSRLVRADNSGYYPPGGVVALQQRSRTMDLAGYNAGVELNLTGQGDPWRLRGASVSANFFEVLGAGVALGRAFQAGDDQAGRDNVVVLSHALWQDRFHGDPSIIGRVITLGGVNRQIVGIAARGFGFPESATAFWIPLHLDPRDPDAYWARGFIPVIGRLRNGVTLAEAQRETRALSHEMLRLFPYSMGENWAAQMTVTPLKQFLTSDLRPRLLLLQGAVGLVLLIACANVAALLLARAVSRQKEIALRVALGAARGRIVRQLLTESMVLALAGGALGIGLAAGGFSLLQSVLPPVASGWSAVQPDWKSLDFVCALSLITGVAFGLVPALSASRYNLAGAIKTGGQRSSGGRTRLRSALIVGEVALAVVLTASAGLLIRSLWRLAQVDPGFATGHIITLRVSPNESLCRERAACLALYSELLRRTREIPGVEDAAAANTIPLSAGIPNSAVKVEGLPYVPAERTAPLFWAGAVTPGYFRVMRIPILQGRAFTDADSDGAARVIIVDAATARRYWPGQDPIGKHVQLVWEERGRTVIGVSADVRQFDVAGRTPGHISGSMYMPYAQTVDTERQLPAAMTLIVRAPGEPAPVAGRIRELVRDLNSNVPVSEVRTMGSLVDDSTRQPRSMMWLFAAFAAVALVLAAVGAYGVVSYSTTQRTFEIGMRVTLGASRRAIFSLVLGQSLRLVAAGLVLGMAASLALTRMLAAFLYGTGATDPLTFTAVCVVLLGVGLVAGFVPARRAASVDPLTALRVE